MAVATRYEHIVFDKKGVPHIKGTTTKVIEVAKDLLAHGWSPEEMHYQHSYLTMGQIHAALAYYWDHREELDADIERREREVEQIKRERGPSKLRAKLKRRGLI
jgi:uncharacterized protein (DUF433 family)